uniref:Bleomycin hydrolase n=1 Tax=Caligus rogercresseyi TaxID=217165 RepID=C1BQW9_CALRO|nr:Bleomycin hydrolase [Caligus rogercresseyi]
MGPLTLERLHALRSEFLSNEKNILAQNAVTKTDPQLACVSRGVYQLNDSNTVFTHKLTDEGRPVCNQRSSGRCWLFATLNAMRVPFMKEMNLQEFEFSQSYLFFVDKIERSHFFLHQILEICQKTPDSDPSDRLIGYLLKNPLQDGGQWGMVVSLIEKYGVLPKKCFPESFSSESSNSMNSMITSKIRQYCKNLMKMSKEGASREKMLQEIDTYMKTIYRVVAICLSIPPETFVWEYYDKSKAYKKIGPLSPLEFYQKHVKPIWNVEGHICLVSDPRPEHLVGKAYIVEYLGNTLGGSPIIYNNQSIETLLSIAAESLKDGSAVWCGLDMTMFHKEKGIMDLKLFDQELTFGTKFIFGMDKADRLRYKDSAMGHAVTLTGVTVDEKGAPTLWRIENSWGQDCGQDGYWFMTSDWFREFGFEIVVKKDYVPKEIIDVFKMEPIVLPAWDPMGVLA